MDRNRVARAVGLIAWGYLLLCFHLTVGTIVLVPNWLCYIFFLKAMGGLEPVVPAVKLLFPLGVLLGVWEGLLWGMSAVGIQDFTLLYGLQLVASVLMIYFHFQFLTNLAENDILFVDEIHRLNRSVEEILYPAMEDFAIDIITGKGQMAASYHLPLPKFTLVGATTRAGQLTAPLRDRFGVVLRLEMYTPEELATIVSRSAKILGIETNQEGALEIASRSRGTPRIANRLLKRVRDFAQVMSDGVITYETAKVALDKLEIDELGLDGNDRRMLETLIRFYKGGPVGLETLAAAIGEEAVTIEDVYEPYLMQIGFLSRTPRGRCATHAAYLHLGMTPPGMERENSDQTTIF